MQTQNKASGQSEMLSSFEIRHFLSQCEYVEHLSTSDLKMISFVLANKVTQSQLVRWLAKYYESAHIAS